MLAATSVSSNAFTLSSPSLERPIASLGVERVWWGRPGWGGRRPWAGVAPVRRKEPLKFHLARNHFPTAEFERRAP